MPVYQYKDKFYDLADTDPFIAKAKILRHLGEPQIPQRTQTVAPPEPDMSASDPFMTGIASAISAEPGAVTQPRPAGYQSVLEKYNIEQAGKPIPFTPEEGAALSNLKNIQRTQAQVAQGREIQARQQAARQAQRQAAKEEDYGITDFFKDTGIDVSKGVVGLGEAYIGLLDLTSGGAAGRVLGDLGYDPERTKKFLTGFQSLTRQEAGRSVQEAEGFINTLSALGVNPTALVGTVAESLPGTVLSGAVGGRFVRFLAGKAATEATSLGLTGAAAEKFIADRIKEQSFKIAAVASGAEGFQSAGAIAEAARQGGREWSDYILPSLGAGFGTAAIGAVGGKIGAKMGVGDIETSIATRSAGIKGVTPTEGPAFTRILKEAAKEGVFEEMPQSAQEQVFQNLALGRPWDEGVDKSAAMGLVAGLAMGGGNASVVAALRRGASSEDVKAVPPAAPPAAPPVAEAAPPVVPPVALPAAEAPAPEAPPVVPPRPGVESMQEQQRAAEELERAAEAPPVAPEPAPPPVAEAAPVAPPVTGAPQKPFTASLEGREIPVTLSRVDEARGNVLVSVNTGKTDEAWKAGDFNQSMYIGPGGTQNAIGERYKKFGEFAKTAESIEAPTIDVNDEGKVTFADGRHRFSYMRDKGVGVIPVAMSEESKANAIKFGLIAEPSVAPAEPRGLVAPPQSELPPLPKEPTPTPEIKPEKAAEEEVTLPPVNVPGANKTNKALAEAVEDGDWNRVTQQLQRSKNPLIAAVGKMAEDLIGVTTQIDPRVFRGYPRNVPAGYDAKGGGIWVKNKTGASNEHVIAHETVHALTIDAIRNPTEKQKSAVNRLNNLYEYVKKRLGKDGKQRYGLTNIEEFIAEGNTNVDFQRELARIPYQRQTAWGAFTKTIADLLGIKDSRALTELIALTEELAGGIPQPLAEETTAKEQPPQLTPPPGFKVKKGRNEQVVLAARELAAGRISKQEYDRYVDFYTPIEPVLGGKIEQPISDDLMTDILTKKIPQKKDPKLVNAPIADGTRVGLRMDIPALEWGRENGVNGSVVSIHQGADPSKARGKNVSYKSTGRLKNVVFAPRSEEAAFGVAQMLEGREGQKKPQQTMEGEWVNTPADETFRLVQSLLDDPNWVQVSLDPLRHSYFYARDSKRPVLSADEALQVGRFVLAKNPVYGEREDFLYMQEPEEGAVVPTSRVGKNIYNRRPISDWTTPTDTKLDDFIYRIQDKLIDTKRVIQEIEAAAGRLEDRWDPYLQEELYHGRTATATKDFLRFEVRPLLEAMKKEGVTIDELDTYLHNRFAPIRNENIANINPNMPDAGSGILTEDAKAYMDALTPEQKAKYERLAAKVDAITQGTRGYLVGSGQESQETINAWEKSSPFYVPLNREDVEYTSSGGMGTGRGFSISGPTTKRATGSLREVSDILANIIMQRERAIVRGEKNRVGVALYGLAMQNPNPDLWLAVNPDATKSKEQLINELIGMGLTKEDAEGLMQEPRKQGLDPQTGLVVSRINIPDRYRDNVLGVRINGKDRFIFFNSRNPRAERMVTALKNLDADQLGTVMSKVAMVTRYFSQINTQYNPVFGIYNFLRDIQGGAIQLSGTDIEDRRAEVLSPFNLAGALKGIYATLRAERADKPQLMTPWSELWIEFQREGGQTGYRDMFSRSQERAEALKAELDRLQESGGKKAALAVPRAIRDWLSDYNETLENAIRLSAYKAALDKGLSKQRAASIAKNLTVNFNRKGQIGNQTSALYSFFNSAVQGTTRLLQTVTKMERPGDIKSLRLSKIGKTIVYGGLLLGSIQAMLLAAFGFDENEPPDFVKDRNLVIPIGEGKYLAWPYPLGYHVIPAISRIITEWGISGFKDTPKRVAHLLDVLLDAFNPIGNAGLSGQTIAPTIFDPLVALFENKDWTGKKIAKEDFNKLDPTPGYTRAKESATWLSKQISYYLNVVSGGDKDKPGLVDLTPDQIDYLAGQLGGGLAREIGKTIKTGEATITGEELPPYNIPLVGRFYGNTKAGYAESQRFYKNLEEINILENQLEGRTKRNEDPAKFKKENPKVALATNMRETQTLIRQIRKERDELIKKGADKEKIQAKEQRMVNLMRRMNSKVAAYDKGKPPQKEEEATP